MIVGGAPLEISDVPWQVALLSAHVRDRDDDGFLDQFCGGSLISAEWVVTAAHCTFSDGDLPLRPSDIDVVAGKSVLSEISSSDRRGVDRIVVHPDYDGQFFNDIALIHLSSAVPLGTRVAPIAFGGAVWDGTAPAADTQYVVSGWGCRAVLDANDDCPIDDPDAYFADALEAVVVRDVGGPTATTCGSNSDFDVALMICAGDLAGGVDSCAGDSGGPLVATWDDAPVLAGVVSFGFGCALTSFPGIYTRVSTYAEWMTSVTDLVAFADWSTSEVFTPLSPARVMDTRSGDKVGTLAVAGGADPYELQVTGRAGVPTGVAAVALNVTAVSTEANDYGGVVTGYPCGGALPDVSNLNFVSGQTIPNSVIAPVSSAGKVCFYVYGKAHLLADVSGYLIN